MTTTTAAIAAADSDYQTSRAYWMAAITVHCPRCKAHPGQMCQSTGGGNSATVATHKARRDRVAHWTDEQRTTYGMLIIRQGDEWWARMPDGYYAEAEAAAKPVPAKTGKQPTPKGVRLSDPQAEEIERAACNAGQTSASTAHFHGDAAHRQTINALRDKGILAEGELFNHGYDRQYTLTDFGWQVYRQHRLIIHREEADRWAALNVQERRS